MNMNSKINLMIVSDKNEVIEELETNLKKLKSDPTYNFDYNINISISHSGNEVFFKALETKYSLFIVDINMKDMNGLEAIQYVKREKMNQSTPVIFIDQSQSFINSSSNEQFIELKKTGKVDLIFKPLSPTILYTKINEMIQTVSPTGVIVNELISIKGISILLVEDDLVAQKVLSNYLQGENANVIVANNGILALEIYQNQNQNIDIILMDVRIPEMDGYEVTKKIRQSKNGKTIPIIGITGNAFEQDYNACIDAGMNEVLVKPLDLDVLISTIIKQVDFKKP